MKGLFTAFSMCQSMFCALPCPLRRWSEEERSRMLLFLPLIGLELGVLQALLAQLLLWLDIPRLLRAAALCAAPLLLTGFLHFDGFMDVTDAVRSYRDLPRRREILKDSRVGSFAVLGAALVLLCQFSAFGSMDFARAHRALVLLPAVSRCCSALAVKLLPPMHSSQYAQSRTGRGQLVFLFILLTVLLVAGFSLCGRGGWALAAALFCYAAALLRAYRSLRGMNGDISGYCLTLSELAGYAVLALF